MKKFLMLAVAVLMIASLSITVCAEGGNGSFVSSPSANRTPMIVDGSNENESCNINEGNAADAIVIVAYADREILPDGGREMESAYATIAGTEDLGELGDEVAELAQLYRVKGEKLAVTDLFEMHHEECIEVWHGDFSLQIVPQNHQLVDNFAGVMHYRDGKWSVIDSTVDDQGVITMSIEDLEGPYAIVVHDGSGMSPQESAFMGAGLSVVAGVLALILIAIVFRKREED